MLQAQALPVATAGQAYSFDFRSLLSATGDPNFAPEEVVFSGSGVPAGMSLSAEGVLTGAAQSSNPAGAAVQVTAAYKGRESHRTFTLYVQEALVTFDPQTLWSDFGTTFAATNSAINGATATVWTVSQRPSGQATQPLALATHPSKPSSGRQYLEVSSETRSAWLLPVAADGKAHGFALDGPGCLKFSNYVAQCYSGVFGPISSARFGVLVDYDNATLTWYQNGVTLFTVSGIDTAHGYSFQVTDRDVPADPGLRKYQLRAASSEWLFAPSGVQPFRR